MFCFVSLGMDCSASAEDESKKGGNKGKAKNDNKDAAPIAGQNTKVSTNVAIVVLATDIFSSLATSYVKEIRVN